MDCNQIRLAGYVDESIVDGPGIRFVIFTQGCKHNCPGCHNPETHDMDAGYLKNCDELIEAINSTSYLKGVTFSGGEPFLQPKACHYIASKIKKEYDILSYSGFTFEELLEKSTTDTDVKDFLNDLDILVDGRFVLTKRSLALKFRGSTNQRIIDVKKSLKENKIITLYND